MNAGSPHYQTLGVERLEMLTLLGSPGPSAARRAQTTEHSAENSAWLWRLLMVWEGKG